MNSTVKGGVEVRAHWIQRMIPEDTASPELCALSAFEQERMQRAKRLRFWRVRALLMSRGASVKGDGMDRDRRRI